MDLFSLFGGDDHQTLELPTGDRAVVSLQGGQLSHWQVEPGADLLYLSPDASATAG